MDPGNQEEKQARLRGKYDEAVSGLLHALKSDPRATCCRTVRRTSTDRIAFINHRGQEQFKVAIMSYVTSVAHVQINMDNCLSSFREFYIDGVVVASSTLEEHIRHLMAWVLVKHQPEIGK